MPKLTVSGVLVALSHKYRFHSMKSFMLDVVNENKEVVHIIFCHEHHLSLYSKLNIYKRYVISKLKHEVLYKDIYDIAVLKASLHTTIEQIGDYEDVHYEIPPNFLTYKGKITSVVSLPLGIYILDSKVELITSYIAGIALDLPEVSCSVAKTDNLHDCHQCYLNNSSDETSLNIGDEILAYNVHKRISAHGIQLICCGKSLIVNFSEKEHPAGNSRLCSAMLDAVHLYNFGFDGLQWLQNVFSFLKEILNSFVPLCCIARRRCHNQQRGIFTELLNLAVAKGMLSCEKRSVSQEFFLQEHSCIITKVFEEPFRIGNPSEFFEKCKTNLKTLWSHNVTYTESNVIIIGYLEANKIGNLQLYSDLGSFDIIIISEDIVSLYGCIVALFNCMFVFECFNIIYDYGNKLIAKKYIMVNFSDVYILHKFEKHLDDDSKCDTYNIDVQCCSMINFRVLEMAKEIEPFFVCKVSISDTTSVWSTFAEFRSSNVTMYPLFKCLSLISVQVSGSIPSFIFKKTKSFFWLQKLHKFYGTLECTTISAKLIIQNITLKNVDYISVTDVLQCDNKSLIFLHGVIIERCLMTPKFASEKNRKLYCNDYSTPGGKTVRLLLQDPLDRVKQIWVYYVCKHNSFSSLYPLGLLPGVHVKINNLQKVVKKNNTYLLCTPFTVFYIMSYDPKDLLLSKTKYVYCHLHNILTLSKSAVLLINATVLQVCRVSFQLLCNSCKSLWFSGHCSYVGCHSKGESTLVARAKIVVDDGTDVALIYLDDDNVRKLLQIYFNKWEELKLLLSDNGGEICCTFGAENLYQCMSSYCFSRHHIRPVSLYCRSFKHSDESKLYCVKLDEFVPDNCICYFT